MYRIQLRSCSVSKKLHLIFFKKSSHFFVQCDLSSVHKNQQMSSIPWNTDITLNQNIMANWSKMLKWEKRSSNISIVYECFVAIHLVRSQWIYKNLMLQCLNYPALKKLPDQNWTDRSGVSFAAVLWIVDNAPWSGTAPGISFFEGSYYYYS